MRRTSPAHGSSFSAKNHRVPNKTPGPATAPGFFVRVTANGSCIEICSTAGARSTGSPARAAFRSLAALIVWVAAASVLFGQFWRWIPDGRRVRHGPYARRALRNNFQITPGSTNRMLTLVTGATGLVGNNAVRLLLDRGEAVRVLARQHADSRPLAGLDVEKAFGDVRDAAAMEQACLGVDRVIHAAGMVHIGWTGLAQQRSVNVDGARNVARGARLAGARLVHVSSVDTLEWGSRESPGDERASALVRIRCPYFLTKLAGEEAVAEEMDLGLDAVIVHPAYMLGPWDWKPSSGKMLLEVGRGRAVLAPPGGNDFCDVRDVVRGILLAAERGESGRRYILGGEPLSYFQAWRLFAQVTGASPPIGIAGKWMLRTAGMAGNLWAKVSGREPDVNSAATAVSSLPHHFTSARAEQELGYRSRPASEAAEAAWNWFLERGYARAKKIRAAAPAR